MKKYYSKLSIILVFIILTMFSGCNKISYSMGNLISSFKGRDAIIQTYDEESNIIDSVRGKSIDIKSATEFNISDYEGNIASPSAVLNITVGGNQMYHVGSSLILQDYELINYFDEYQKTVNIENFDSSTPFLSRIYNRYKNAWSGHEMLLLIRSQTGKPLATFVGNNVSIFSTDIDKSTGVYIDGKYLFIYRCDYTIYEIDLLY